MAIVPISVLLMASFFVLVAVRKNEEKLLKAFGYVVVGFLWLAALLVFSEAAYKMDPRSAMDERMIQQQMKMNCMSKMMQKGNPPPMEMLKKGSPMKNEKRPGMPAKCQGNKGIVYRAE
jgi:peroxiredoxin family protein